MQESRRSVNSSSCLVVYEALKTGDGTGLARAIDYSLKRWPALVRYLDNGILPIDNMVENAIRPITLGRRYPRSTIRPTLELQGASCAAVRVLGFA